MGHIVIITEEVLTFLHRSVVSKISIELTKIINNEKLKLHKKRFIKRHESQVFRDTNWW